MITREQKRAEKLSAIYEKIANKELSFGCKVWVYKYKTDNYIYGRIVNSNEIQTDDFWMMLLEDYPLYKNTNPKYDNFIDSDKWYTDIIWHPVMIWDVMGWEIEKWIEPYNMYNWEYWDYPRKPIEEQSDECIDYIYNLLDNEQ